jgi:hypothetical protein
VGSFIVCSIMSLVSWFLYKREKEKPLH